MQNFGNLEPRTIGTDLPCKILTWLRRGLPIIELSNRFSIQFNNGLSDKIADFCDMRGVELTHNSPKYLELNSAEEKLKGNFPIHTQFYALGNA